MANLFERIIKTYVYLNDWVFVFQPNKTTAIYLNFKRTSPIFNRFSNPRKLLPLIFPQIAILTVPHLNLKIPPQQRDLRHFSSSSLYTYTHRTPLSNHYPPHQSRPPYIRPLILTHTQQPLSHSVHLLPSTTYLSPPRSRRLSARSLAKQAIHSLLADNLSRLGEKKEGALIVLARARLVTLAADPGPLARSITLRHIRPAQRADLVSPPPRAAAR